jgi:PAS domain S-box-containing protein
MTKTLHIILIEDRPDDAELILHELRRGGQEVICDLVDNTADFLNCLKPDIDVILADYNVPQFGALAALSLVKERKLDIPLIVLTGTIGDEAAVECLRGGAADYLLKDRLARLPQAVAHAVEERALRVQKKQAEEAVRASEARYRRLADNAPDVIFRYQVSPVLACEYVSPVVEEMLGYSPEDYYANPELIFTRAHPDDRTLLAELAQDSSQLKLPFTLRWFAKDGRTVWTEQRMTFTRDEKGVVTSVEGIARDITAARQAEEALRKSENRFRLLFEESPVGIAILREGALLYTNRAFMSIFGFADVTDLAGTPFEARIAPQQRAEVMHRLTDQAFTLPLSLETYGQRKDGSTFPIYVQIGLIELADGLAQVAYINDMTIHKQLQEETHKAELLRMELAKEKELAELKERFASMVSHEFRTPLTVIRMSCGLIEEYADRLPPEKTKKFLNDIQSQVEYMVELLEDVLTIGKTRAGKVAFNPELLDLSGVCADIVEQLQLTSGSGHKMLFSNYSQIRFVYLDPHLLRHILVNLLSNAIKYSPKGSEVRLTVREEEKQIVFQIGDQGIGIPPEDQEHLFEPFHRASNTRHIQGTGLGLAIVKGNVEAHGGNISVSSAEGAGTTFTVTLPITFPIGTASPLDRPI